MGEDSLNELKENKNKDIDEIPDWMQKQLTRIEKARIQKREK